MRGWFVGFSICLLGAIACESDHDSLAQRSSGGSAGSGGAGNRGGSTGDQGGFTTIGKGGSGNGTGGSSGGRPPDEPPGENVLTFLHGIVDAKRVVVCFVVGEGAKAKPVGSPEPAAGLGFGERMVVRAIEGADFAKDEIQPVVITGELERLDGLDCAAAIDLARAEQARGEDSGTAGAGGASNGGAAGAAGAPAAEADASTGGGGAAGAGGAGGSGATLPEPPVLRVGSLPSLPAGTLATGRSLLFAADGCIGGPAFAGRRAEDACGELYTPRAPTLSAVVVPLSRRASTLALGLQAVHASVGSVPLGLLDVEAETTQAETTPVYVGSSLSLGAVVPRIPRLDIPSAMYGATAGDGRIVVFSTSGEEFSEPWPSILKRAGLASLDDGSTYALVVIGPNLELTARGFWNPPAIAVVPTDPPPPDGP